MLKHHSNPFQLIFDIETIPCLETARRVYPQLQEWTDTMRADGWIKSTPVPGAGPRNRKKIPGSEVRMEYTDQEIDKSVLEALYRIAGSTDDNPRPFLKFFLHRVVSISGISRKQVMVSDKYPIGVELKWFSLPNGDMTISESDMISRFLRGIGEKNPQIIGWCNTLFDMPVLMQRAMINGLALPKLQRPAKPWEGADYFGKGSDYNIDLMDLIASRSGQSKATLNEYARALRIPGKVGVSGDDVAEMWFAGKHREIINYNECDTASTYLIWLEMLHLSGHVSAEDYSIEKKMFRDLLNDRIQSGSDHLKEFAREWDRLQGVIEPTLAQVEFLATLDQKIEDGPEAIKEFIVENPIPAVEVEPIPASIPFLQHGPDIKPEPSGISNEPETNLDKINTVGF